MAQQKFTEPQLMGFEEGEIRSSTFLNVLLSEGNRIVLDSLVI
jgi:hypothetical protein